MIDAAEELLAREKIRDVLARYCEKLDEYDIDGVAACFTEDAVSDYGPGRGGAIHGRAAIAARIADGQATFVRTHHQLGQTRVTLEAERARATSYVTATHRLPDGSIDTVWLRYLDTLTQTGSDWLISHREVQISDVDGFPGGEWVWVARRAPKR